MNDQLCPWVALLQPAKPSRPELQMRIRLMRAEDYYREVRAARTILKVGTLARWFTVRANF